MGDLLGSPRVASLFSSVRLSFSLGYFIRVASESSSKEQNNSIIFLFLKILFVFLRRGTLVVSNALKSVR
jgi:hypothetical protein